LIRIAIATLGCKINQAESSAIIAQFENAEIVSWHEKADVYIINTCTVTNRTDYKSRNLIRQALDKKALDPLIKIVVTGCYVQRSAEQVKNLGAVDYIVDNQQKLEIAEILSGSSYHFMDIMDAKAFAYKPFTRMHERTRAFMKIQDGCDFYCSYCAVPYGRGHTRSAKLEQVLEQARLLVEAGYKEIVLGGVNLGLYRDGENSLAAVVQELGNLDGLELIRLSSLEPQLLTEDLITTLSRAPKLCPHFHIPLQAGSDTVLTRMGRRYDTALISRLVARLNQAFPDVALGMDVITGFPGESEAEHRQSVELLKSLSLAYLHVFSFSKRKGTPAEKMPFQVPKDIKILRSSELHELSENFQRSYRKRLVEGEVQVRGIVESCEHGISEFVSDHYLRMAVPGNAKVGEMLITKAVN